MPELEDGVSTMLDKEQLRLMDEVCILVDENDNPIGSATKKYCHTVENINRGVLHRGFGVYLFDTKNRLLLQQRASEKITFPDVWSNTCCSHPLNNATENGSDVETAILGAKKAAQRKLLQELGINAEQVPEGELRFLTRLYYKATTEGLWGEHESYALLIKSDVFLDPNPNEVRNTKYVTVVELKEMLENADMTFSPWFRMVCYSKLFSWWEHLTAGSLDLVTNDMKIYRMV